MKNRWISKTASTRQERRGSMGSMGCDDISSKDSYCLSPNAGVCVNGIPDWENPMEATLTSIPNNETSPPMWKAKIPSDTNTRRRNSLSNNSPVKLPVSPQKHTMTQNPTNFARMVIECDDKFNQSDGELTFDESLAHDENFGHVQHNYHIPREVTKEKKIPSFQSPPQIPTRTASMRSSSIRSHPSISTSSNSIPVSPGMSLEEEEMRQLEIAMERSLQDLNSCASYGNGSLLSERSYTNTVGSRYTAGGRNKISDSGSANSMSGAGCHLGMVSSSSFRNNNHSAPTKSSSQNRIDALHAIVEENEASSRSIRFSNHHHHRPNYQNEQEQSHSYLDEQYSINGYRSPNQIPRTKIDPNLAAARIRELEREKEMLEMVLKDNSIISTEEQHEIHFQPPPITVRPTLSSNRSINSMNTNELLYQPSRNPTKKSSSFRSTDVPSAGCHLQMYAARSQSSRHLNGSDNNSSTSLTYNINNNINNNNNNNHNNNHNSHSNASSSSSSNSKLVWKRGPNGAWGRFLDDGIDYSSHHNNSNDAVPNNNNNNISSRKSGNDQYYHHHHHDDDDEDAQIAEALRRSMQQM